MLQIGDLTDTRKSITFITVAEEFNTVNFILPLRVISELTKSRNVASIGELTIRKMSNIGTIFLICGT